MRGLAAAAALLADGGGAAADPGLLLARDVQAAVAEASALSGLPAPVIEAVIAAESGGDPTAVSPAGAMGLMQLMPRTWRELRGRLGLGPDPFEARDNVLAGAHYLREMYERFGPEGFLAAYNAGPARYAQHLAGRPLPAETRRYVARIAGGPGSGAATPGPARSWAHSPLFPE